MPDGCSNATHVEEERDDLGVQRRAGTRGVETAAGVVGAAVQPGARREEDGVGLVAVVLAHVDQPRRRLTAPDVRVRHPPQMVVGPGNLPLRFLPLLPLLLWRHLLLLPACSRHHITSRLPSFGRRRAPKTTTGHNASSSLATFIVLFFAFFLCPLSFGKE